MTVRSFQRGSQPICEPLGDLAFLADEGPEGHDRVACAACADVAVIFGGEYWTGDVHVRPSRVAFEVL